MTSIGISLALMLAASWTCTTARLERPQSPGTTYVAGGMLTVGSDSLTVTYCTPTRR